MEKNKSEINIQITEGGKHILLFKDNSDELICKTTFYDFDFDFTDEEKKLLGKKMSEAVFQVIAERGAKISDGNWAAMSSAFKDAYRIQDKSRHSIVWLMTSILEISKEEAERRWDIAQELMSHPDFKDKESIIVDKVYLNRRSIRDYDKSFQYLENGRDKFTSAF